MNLRAQLFRHPRLFQAVMSLYPPLLGAGIRVTRVSHDYREVVVELRDTRVNRNAFGTHFGGSLYAMTDAFYALMLVAILGPDYIVWDKAAQIDFIKPGLGTLRARFMLSDAQIVEIRTATATGAKYQPTYPVDVRDAKGELIARIEKTLYIRRKPRTRASQ